MGVYTWKKCTACGKRSDLNYRVRTHDTWQEKFIGSPIVHCSNCGTALKTGKAPRISELSKEQRFSLHFYLGFSYLFIVGLPALVVFAFPHVVTVLIALAVIGLCVRSDYTEYQRLR